MAAKYSYFSRRDLFEISGSLAGLSLIAGCRYGQVSSGVKDLTDHTSPTVATPERVRYVIDTFRMHDWVDQGTGQSVVFENLSTVPDSYLKFLQERATTVGFRISYGGEAAGVCHFDNVGATLITLNSPSFATIHEVGHGVETYAHKLKGVDDASSIRDRTHNNVINDAESNAIRDYAKSNSKELWADGFSSFYRSPKSRADLKQMPITYAYLKSILAAPVNLASNELADFAPQPVTPTTTAIPDSPAAPQGQASDNSPCAAPTDSIVALICEISKHVESGTFGLVADNGIIIPSTNQFLSAIDRSLVLAKVSLTTDQAAQVKVLVGSSVVAIGLKRDAFSGRDDFFSTSIRIPLALTPERSFVDTELSLNLNSKKIASVPVRLSRYSLCGSDVADLRRR